MKKPIISTALFAVLACSGCKKTAEIPAAASADKPAVPAETVQPDTVKTPNTAAQIYAKQQVPVLCYHRITEGRKGDYTVSPSTFSAHLDMLADSGYHTVSPDQLYNYLVYNDTLPAKPVMITFDDSREEHSSIAAPELEKRGFRGTFFIMTITYNKKNYMTKDQIAALAKSGHTVGLHTWDHTMVTKYKTPEDWEKQIIAPAKKLSEITGAPVEFLAYPNGVYNHESAVETAKYMKLSFSLADKRDTLEPLQCIRRIIVTDCSPQRLLKSMNSSFSR